MYRDLKVIERKPEDRRTRVCIIYTGGTIGMVPKARGLEPATLEELLHVVPSLGEEDGIELGLVAFKEPVDSTFVSKEHWLAMAAAIEEHYEAFDGFVVLHGTDTMAFTTSALSFLLNNLGKPVVVTGSQLPIHEDRGDGRMNLIHAVAIAGYRATGLPRTCEVTLCFMDRLLRGNRAVKVSAEEWQGFDSPNFPRLGSIGEHIRIRKEFLRSPPKEGTPFYADKKFAGEVKVIYVTPGMTPAQLDRDLSTANLDGALLVTYGAGNAPSSEEFLEPLRSAIEGKGDRNRIQILNITQCLGGTVEMGLYAASAGLLDIGVASGLDLTFEAALAKMYWALAKYTGDEIKSGLQIAQRGEQSENLFDLVFSPEERGATRARSIIQPPVRYLHGYDQALLKSASFRVKGLHIIPDDEAIDQSAFRVFVGRQGAEESTSTNEPYFAGEYRESDLLAGGSLIIDVTRVVGTVIQSGPIYIGLVGLGAKLWCESITLTIFTDASYSRGA